MGSEMCIRDRQEMFLTAQAINSATFKTFEIFLTVAVYYLLLTTLWGFVQQWIERRFAVPAAAVSSPRLRERLFAGSGAK